MKNKIMMGLILMLCLFFSMRANAAIPDDAKVFNGHSYKFFDGGCTWSEADSACRNMGGHLVTITSSSEQNFCQSLMGGICPKYCWIGAENGSSGWGWITGEAWDYTYWESGQPNGSSGGTYGLISYYQDQDEDELYSWDDQGDSGTSPSSTWSGSPYFQTTETYSYICEWDEVKKAENPYTDYSGEGPKPLTTKVNTVVKKITKQKTEEVKGSAYPLLQARAVNVKSNTFTLKWNKLDGATHYLVYGNKCGKTNRYQFIKKTKKTSFKPKKLKKGKFYKYVVVAAMNSKVISVSKTVHVGMKPKQNPTKVKVGKKNVVLMMNSSLDRYKISYKILGTTLKQHRKIRCETDNTNVAIVSSKGLIKAVGTGECNIYVYAQNGVSAKISVTVMD